VQVCRAVVYAVGWSALFFGRWRVCLPWNVLLLIRPSVGEFCCAV